MTQQHTMGPVCLKMNSVRTSSQVEIREKNKMNKKVIVKQIAAGRSPNQ